jgi:hypothetical protein
MVMGNNPFGGFMPAIRNNSDALLQTGIGLLSGRTANEQAALGLQGFAQVRQDNKTKQWIAQNAPPEIAQAVQAGVITPADGFKMLAESRTKKAPIEINGKLIDPDTYQVLADYSTPEKPKLDFQVLPDGTYGTFDQTQGQFNPLGKAEKPSNGLRVTLPDGTEVAQGAFGTQDQKNVANRVTEAQDLAAAGATLKQTASVLRNANENVGYSGVGGGIVGGVLDAAEQFGLPSAGSAAARAQMRSGGLDVALAQVQKTKGAVSNAEMSLFMQAAPGLQNTPQGNAALIDMIEKVGDRQILRATEMEKWRQQYGTLDGFEGAWGQYVEQNPIITPEALGLGSSPSAAPAPQGGVVDYREYFKR